MIYFQSQVDRLLKIRDEEIERLRKALDEERTRANNAVDRMLNQAQIGGITNAPRQKSEKADEIIKSIQSAVRVGQDIKGEPENA
jgi:hypothetical protein